jgi:3-oxoacyl-[acyl-carrier-protein] synthase-3
VVSRKGEFARVISSAMDADSELEGMYRGTEPFSVAPRADGKPLDLRSRKEQFQARTGSSEVTVRVSTGLRNLVSTRAHGG